MVMMIDGEQLADVFVCCLVAQSGNGGATSDDTWRRSLSHLGMDIRGSSSNTASGSVSASSSAQSVDYDSEDDDS